MCSVFAVERDIVFDVHLAFLLILVVFGCTHVEEIAVRVFPGRVVLVTMDFLVLDRRPLDVVEDVVRQCIEDLIGGRLAQSVVETFAKIIDEAILASLLENGHLFHHGLLHSLGIDANILHLCEQLHAHFVLIFDVAGFDTAVEFIEAFARDVIPDIAVVEIHHKSSIFVSFCKCKRVENTLGQRTPRISARVASFSLLSRRCIPRLQVLRHTEELLIFLLAVRHELFLLWHMISDIHVVHPTLFLVVQRFRDVVADFSVEAL